MNIIVFFSVMFKYICTKIFNERSWGLKVKINLLLVDKWLPGARYELRIPNQKQPPPITRDKHDMSSPSHRWTWPARTLLLLRYPHRLGLGTDLYRAVSWVMRKASWLGGSLSSLIIRSKKNGWMIRFWEIDCTKYVDSVSSVPWFRDSQKNDLSLMGADGCAPALVIPGREVFSF